MPEKKARTSLKQMPQVTNDLLQQALQQLKVLKAKLESSDQNDMSLLQTANEQIECLRRELNVAAAASRKLQVSLQELEELKARLEQSERAKQCELEEALLQVQNLQSEVQSLTMENARLKQEYASNQTLNQMDGIAEDCDILFLLGTNRPESLEPALASRPGRVDQAIMIPLPDEGCRGRLFDYYSRHIPLAFSDFQKLVESTSGASAAFIRELIRKAVLLAAEEGDVPLQEHHVETALRMLKSGGALMEKLLAYKSIAVLDQAHDCAPV